MHEREPQWGQTLTPHRQHTDNTQTAPNFISVYHLQNEAARTERIRMHNNSERAESSQPLNQKK